MMDYTDEEEQLVAARTIWNLSFDKDVKQKIVEEPGCLVALEKLKVSSNTNVKKMASGALWSIRGQNHRKDSADIRKYK